MNFIVYWEEDIFFFFFSSKIFKVRTSLMLSCLPEETIESVSKWHITEQMGKRVFVKGDDGNELLACSVSRRLLRASEHTVLLVRRKWSTSFVFLTWEKPKRIPGSLSPHYNLVKSITPLVLEEKLKPLVLNGKETVQELQICILDDFSHFKSQDVKESKDSWPSKSPTSYPV